MHHDIAARLRLRFVVLNHHAVCCCLFTRVPTGVFSARQQQDDVLRRPHAIWKAAQNGANPNTKRRFGLPLCSLLINDQRSFAKTRSGRGSNLGILQPTKCGVGFLSSSQDLLLSRQMIYDNSFEWITTQGWSFLPLDNYGGGAAEAKFRPLEVNVVDYDLAWAQYLPRSTSPSADRWTLRAGIDY